METIGMRVTKRDGELEEIAFDKILTRIKKLGQEVNIQINYQLVECIENYSIDLLNIFVNYIS